MFKAATEKQMEIDQMIREKISNILKQGNKIATDQSTITVEKGESGVFGLGILNVDTSTSTNKDFYVTVEVGDAYDEEGPITSNLLTRDNILLRESSLTLNGKMTTLTIDPNKEEILTIGVTVPTTAASGTHILDVYVCLQGSPPPPNEPFDRFSDQCDSALVASQGTSKLYDSSVHKLYVEVP